MDVVIGAFEYRPASGSDAAFYADVLTAVRPTAPVDPLVTRYEWEHPPDAWVSQHFIAVQGGAPIGFAFFEHPRWDRTEKRFGSVGAELLPDHRDAAGLSAMLEEMERRLEADGARTIAVRAAEDDTMRIDMILGRGYREDRRHRRWELDLGANRERIVQMTEVARARMREQGVRLLTLAEDRDPEKARKIWRLSIEADRDIPSTLPIPEDTLEDYVRWFEAPEIRQERFWLAREGDDIVGLSVLSYPPVRGIVTTAFTATAAKVRGRGIARAVKCETLTQAIALGVDRVRAGNDAANDPILHINASMGYQAIAGGINFLKDA